MTGTGGVTRWRKRPVTVEAVQWTGDNSIELAAFTGSRFGVIDPEDRTDAPELTGQVFDVLHCTWVGMSTGQWVIKGVRGEFYPCDDAVLAETYDPAGDDDGPVRGEAEIRADERAKLRPILAHKIAVAGGQYDDAFGSDAREAIAEAVTEAMDDLDSPGSHYVTFDGDAYYIIDHPASCCATARDLCEPAAAAIRIVGHGAPDGRWRITGISEGLPDLERVEPQP